MSPLITSFICVRNSSPMERYHRVFVSSCLAFPADLKVPQVSYEEQGLKTWGFFKLSEECLIYYSLLIRRCDAFRTSKASSSPCLWCKCRPDTDIHALFFLPDWGVCYSRLISPLRSFWQPWRICDRWKGSTGTYSSTYVEQALICTLHSPPSHSSHSCMCTLEIVILLTSNTGLEE